MTSTPLRLVSAPESASPQDALETAPPGLVDASALQEIAGGDPAIMDDIVGEFAETARETVARVDTALRAGDVLGAMRAAHSLKGSSGMIGAGPLHRLSLAVERSAATGDLATARGHFVSLQKVHLASIAELRALVTEARGA